LIGAGCGSVDMGIDVGQIVAGLRFVQISITGASKRFDLRSVSVEEYRRKVQPLRYFLGATTAVLVALLLADLWIRGASILTESLGLVLAGYLLFVVFALTRRLTPGPLEMSLGPNAIEIVYDNGKVRALPVHGKKTWIRLSGMSAATILGRPAAAAGIPRLLRIDSGSPFALTEEALDGLNTYLRGVGAQVIYDGSKVGVAGSHVWQYLLE
jgi:hypothetical protein